MEIREEITSDPLEHWAIKEVLSELDALRVAKIYGRGTGPTPGHGRFKTEVPPPGTQPIKTMFVFRTKHAEMVR